jgi:hypothetical protein
MDKKKLMIIQELMDQLTEEMEYSPEELSSRLGRDKPMGKGVEIMKVEAGGDMGDEKMPMAMDMDEEMSMDDEEMDPEYALKKRLMKLRA